MKKREDPHQLTIDWTRPQAAVDVPADHLPVPNKPARQSPPPLVQRLRWDFRTSFPEPTEEALQAGVILDEDNHPENIRAIHEEHEREALATLKTIEQLADARRRGVDAPTGKPPRTHAGQEQLRRRQDSEHGRLERHYLSLMDVYENAFGRAAAQAFEKSIRARHAGIPVELETPIVRPADATVTPRPARARRTSATLPIPRPLHSAVTAGVFGRDEKGKPIRPGTNEVRAITEQHAERMTEMDEGKMAEAVAKYAEDFGEKPAAQLERYVRRERQRGR